MGKSGRSSSGEVRQKVLNFYLDAVTEAEKVDLQSASEVDGIDDEIALLRVMLKRVIEQDPGNIKLQMDAASTLAYLMRTRYNISRRQKDNLAVAIRNVLKEIAIPLGIKYLPD